MARWRVVLSLFVIGGFAACGGSADSGGSAPSASAMIGDLCAKMAAAPCATAAAEQDCHDWLDPDLAHAKSEGCEAELDQFLKCATTHPITCTQYDTLPAHPTTDSDCDIGPYFECYTGVPPNCAVGSGVGGSNPGCSLKCPTFSAACSGPDPNGPQDCVCDTGPHVGASFQVSSCGDEMMAYDTGHLCK